VLSVGGLRNLPDLLSSLGDHVKTDLPLGDALALYDLVKNVDPRTFEHVSIDSGNFIYECGPPYGTASCPAAYEYPYDRSFATIHHFVQNIFPPGAIVAEHAPVSVQDASGRNQGAAKRWAALFSNTGLAAGDGGAARVSPTTRVIDASGGRYASTASWLGQYFGVQVETAAATGAAAPATGSTAAAAPRGITLLLGQDEERSFYGTVASAYATQSGGYSNAAGGTGTGTTAVPRRTTPPAATAKPAPPPTATAASAPTSTPRGLLDPPFSTSTAAPSPTAKPTPTPKAKSKPTPQPSSTP
jgi:hypothetical protein